MQKPTDEQVMENASDYVKGMVERFPEHYGNVSDSQIRATIFDVFRIGVKIRDAAWENANKK